MKRASLKEQERISILELINNFYKKQLLYYKKNGYIFSTNKQIINIIETLNFCDVKLLLNNSLEMEILFNSESNIYAKKIIIDNVIECNEYNYFIQSPNFIHITMSNSILTFHEELQKINIQDNHKEIEEWLNEIKIFSFIQKHISSTPSRLNN
ncbi:hypothetical protein [Bacillus cereus group sp. TH152-1LC]|uniref:hypothetical protein n=1 Tax=Bacillus cereus group sp. TH152-1LC TaxID=3018060 RepID=UPI0022E1CE00|nr:hypothetical protein [Bacillus cereus group sp. TH152-1LC]MDA1674517.1 hypothetical protein [Bacillus cereus group sp. TH152-1LC]